MLREVLESVEIVPKAYASYRPLIVDGLVFFLEHLPEDRLSEIFEEQLSLESELDSNERIVALLRRCPTLHKLAQVVGHDRGLPLDLRVRLQTLESMPPTSDFEDVLAVVRAELGDTTGVEIGSEALAEGSVAVVVPFVWTAAAEPGPIRGVLKIVKPNARRWLLEELDIWPALGTYLEERARHYSLPALAFAETLGGVRALLSNEIRLDLEQERLARARRFYADMPQIVIPRVLPMSTPRMTAMEYIEGRKITQSDAGPVERRRLARTALEALLAKPFWSNSEDAHFHADPHAGNLLATPDGRIAAIDWALTTTLSAAERNAVVQTLLGAATLDAQLVMKSVSQLGRITNEDAVLVAIRAALRDLRGGAFPGFTWLTGLLDGLAREALVQFPDATALFRKSLLTLQGVAEDVSGEVSVDDVLVAAGIRAFASEIPARSFAPVASRDFRTHVSNLDVLATLATAPLLPARFWIGAWGDVLAAFARAGARNSSCASSQSSSSG
jgi:ubiquinone biosynthesis protein